MKTMKLFCEQLEGSAPDSGRASKQSLLLLITVALIFSVSSMPLQAQVPHGFNYQALAVDSSGEPVRSTILEVRLTILSDTMPDAVIWSELHSSVMTNSGGLFSLVLGSGARQTSSTVGTFNEIDWGLASMFLRTEVYHNSQWHLMGTTRLWSVPYALSAGELAGAVKSLQVAGVADSGDEALFEVRNKDGDIVFAVYNEGVRINVGDGAAKASKSGFAIGSFDRTKADITDLFVVNRDSVRVYLDDNATKAIKGGFAIGSFDRTKGVSDEYFRVTRDSTRIYLSDDVKASKGGFAIGSFDRTKGMSDEFLRVTRDSTRVYLPDNSKAIKGGFAIGSFDRTKSGKETRFLEVTQDSTRVYVTNQSAAGSVGGFAVKALEDSRDYFNITGVTEAETIDNESRIMWYPKKSSLLAGEIQVAHPDSVGEFSMALGYRNIAKGDWSQAMGYQSVARGNYSTAIGYEAVASASSFAFGTNSEALGFNSFALGSKGVDIDGNQTGIATKAVGDYSFAFGLGSVASGLGSFVLGANCTAGGKFATAAGFDNNASGDISFTMGKGNTASGLYSIALGADNTSGGTASIAFGQRNSAGSYAIVGGNDNNASGVSSFAIGSYNQATGDGTIIAGSYNTATQTGAAAFGSMNSSTGVRSFAIGNMTTASGVNSFAMGRETVAGGDHSFASGYQSSTTRTGTLATGYQTVASGSYSASYGYRTESQAYASLVIGRNNVIEGNSTSWQSGDPVLVVGNGTGTTSRRNALTLLKNGNMTILGTLTQSSDLRLKKNIIPLDNVLPTLITVSPILFEFKDTEMYPDKQQIGLSAQEVQELFPQLVKEDSQGYLSVDYSRLSVLLLQALKEQQEIIESQKADIHNLSDVISEVLERLTNLEQTGKK